MGDFDDINIKIAVDAAGAESGLNNLSSSIDKVSENIASLGEGVNFDDAISQACIAATTDVNNLDAVIEGVIEGISAESIDIAVGVDAEGASEVLMGLDSALQETTENTEDLGDALAAPMSASFVVTAGDVVDALDSIITKIQGAESSVAGFNKLSSGIEQISGISADAAKQLAIAISDEDMSIQGALESQKILSKQHVDSVTEMQQVLESWKSFANANDEQAASLQEKLIPAWNQFGISADEQSQYFGALTTLFQETTLSSSDFAGAIMKTGKPLSDMGLSLDQVAKLYLTMEESGLVGRKGMTALSGAITDINKAAEETGTAIPKGNEAYAELIKQMGITPDKVNAANTAFSRSVDAVDRWSEAMDKGDTSSEKLGAQIAKTTAGFEEMLVPLAPAATGVAAIAGAGAQLAIFDAFIGGGRIKGGLDTIISKLPLIGTAAAGATPEIAGVTGALSLLGGPVTIGLLAAAGVAVAAYATNFGGFADNVNDSISKAQSAVEEFGKGNYEEAGEMAAKSLVDGFEALGDLLSEVVRKIPELKVDADKLLKGLKEGLKTAAKSAGEELRLSLEVYLKNASVDVDAFCKKIYEAIKNHPWETLGDAINSAILDPFNAATADVSGFISGIETGIKTNNWSTVGKYINDAITGELNRVLPFGLGDIASEMIKGIVTPSPTVKTGENELAQTKVGAGGFTYGGKTTATSVSPANPWVAVAVDSITPAANAAISDIKSAAIAILAKERDLTTAGATEMYESAEKVRTKYDALAQEAANAAASLSSGTKSTKDSIKSYDNAEKALADATLAEGARFKVGMQEYIKRINTAGDTAQYIAEEQGAAADLTRAQAGIDKKKLDAITKDQQDASEAVTKAHNKYAGKIEEAAYTYSESVKFATTDEQLNSAKITYLKTLDDIVHDASVEGVSLEGMNTQLQIGTETVKTLKDTYTKLNAGLEGEIKDLEGERKKKISGAKAGTVVDTSSIDKKIVDLRNQITLNTNAINTANATVSKNTDSITTASKITTKQPVSVTPYTPQALAIGGAPTPVTVTNLEGISDIEEKYKYGPSESSNYAPISMALKDTFQKYIDYGETRDNARNEAFTVGLGTVLRREGISVGTLQTSPDYASDLVKAATKEQIDDVNKLLDAVTSQTQSTKEYTTANDQSLKIQTDLSTSIQKNNKDYISLKNVFDDLNKAAGTNEKFTSTNAIKTYDLAEAYKKATALQDAYQKATQDSIYTQEEQNDVSKKYADTLDYLKKVGLDTTDGINGLPPSLKLLYDALMSIISGVSNNAVSAGVEISESVESTMDSISNLADQSSNAAFTKIQNKFADLKKQFDDGAISQDKYLEELRKASAETDTLSRSTNILKGDQKEAVLSLERDIKQHLMNIEAGYGYNTGEQVAAIGGSITKLGGISSGGITQEIPKINTLIDAYQKQGVASGKAAALQFVLNDAISDNSVKVEEAKQYLEAYNTVTGQNAEITQKTASDALDMMNAMQQANQLQQLYTDAMKEGGISGEELKGIQSQQTSVQDALTTASSLAKDATGNLPPALQAVATAVNSVISQIYAQLQTATNAAAKAVEVANTQSSRYTPGGELTGPQVSNTVNISGNQFGQTTTPEDVARKAVMSFGAAF